MAAQNLRQRPHEDVVTPVRLQVAVDEGDHLVIARQLQPAAQPHAHLRVGRDSLRVNAIVHHRDALAKRLGEGAGLPACGRNAGIRHLEMQQVVDILHPQARHLARVARVELGVEPHIGTLRMVKKFAIDAQPRPGPDILQTKALSPARVRHDHIGHKALCTQLQGRPQGRLGPDGLGLQVHHPGVNVRRTAARGAVGHHAHALPLRGRILAHRQRPDRMLRVGRQGRRQMQKLARKALVDKQDIH